MRTFLAFCIALVLPAVVFAQQAGTDATLRITVVDQSGAVLVGARVEVTPLQPPTAIISLDTSGRGEAIFESLPPGRYTIHAEAPGFEARDVRDVRLRPGETRREIKLPIAKLATTVDVGRDPRERGADPRSDAFATVLGQAEINELPDDPDEMERVLKDMAGPGAILRVNGFRGGKLPPKDQIAQIRFHRNMFAADTHEPGFVSVDIVTKPGLENWRGSTNLGFRDDVLSAKNAFAPSKGDERNERVGVSLSGPLWKKHTSLSLSVDGIDAFDTKTVVAALPSGFFADTIRRPNDTMNVSARVEHGLTKTQQLRSEFQHNHAFSDNLGVGDFDLPERAFDQTRDENVFRASVAGSLRKSLFNEFRLQFRSQETAFGSMSQAPAVLVLNAFNSGGAQISGARTLSEVEINDDLDIAKGKHAVRVGFQFEGGRYGTSERRNATGTFTFADLAAYAAGRPTTFTRNVGDPSLRIAQTQTGIYVQDDYRARKELTVSAGVRAEHQSQIGGLHLGPRAGLAWSPLKSGKTTVRAGGGLFFDWFDAVSYQQSVQLDGTHQQIETIVQPTYPDPFLSARAFVLPNGRVQLAAALDQPQLFESTFAVEQQLPGAARLNAMYIHRRGSSLLRGVNVNAPLNGVRPDASAGTITEIRSTASSSFDALSFNLNLMNPQRRIFMAANYTLARSVNEADGPFSLAADASNLAAERGPAPMDARHRFMSFVNFPVYRRVTAGTSIRVQSALPYNVTTGRDDNGDTISNDRPAGVTRNSARGRALVDLSARVSWKIGFGGAPRSGPGGPQVRILRGGGDSNPLADMGGGMGEAQKRYGLEMYAQAFNLVNRVNALNFSGVVTSPFFGQATSAGPARRIEVGTRLTF